LLQQCALFAVEHSIVTETSTPSLRHVIGRGVAAVTSADGRLYVLLYQNSERIEVYDLNTFKQLRTLHVTGVSTDTWDRGLIACTINKCLYVSDCDRNRVFRVDLTENEPEIINWQVGLNPTGLSLSAEQNLGLLVACWRNMTIEQYTTRGTPISEIRLQSSDDRPLHPVHAIQLTSGQFVVCCCDGSKEMYDVVEVDSHGRVVYSYRTQLQSSISQNYSYMPRHLAVDKSNKCILVADCGNDKIVILSRSLKFDAHDLIDATSVDGGFRSPSCLDFDESEGRLCFNEMSGRIFVFSNVFNIADSFQ
jgi:6-phosphogluconolactonase (cycloisomerase 2 family)